MEIWLRDYFPHLSLERPTSGPKVVNCSKEGRMGSYKYSYICSDHFLESDFAQNTGIYKRLKKMQYLVFFLHSHNICKKYS